MNKIFTASPPHTPTHSLPPYAYIQRSWRPLHFAVKACASQQVGEGGVAKEMVSLLLLAQGDNGMLTTQKSARAKKSGEEPKRNKVRIHGTMFLYLATQAFSRWYYVGVVDSLEQVKR